MKITEINNFQHWCMVRFDKQQTPERIAVQVGIANNKTIAIWNNQDGDQINIPFKDLGIKYIVFETAEQKDEK